MNDDAFTTLCVGPPFPETIKLTYRLPKSSPMIPMALRDIYNNIDASKDPRFFHVVGDANHEVSYWVERVKWKLEDEDIVHTIILKLARV